MLEIIQYFEQSAMRFRPIILIGPGLAAVLLGLFLWLGGLGFRRVLVTIVGAVSGGMCGFFIIGRNIMLAIVLAGVAAAIAIMFERIFITILTAVLAAVLGFAVLAGPYIENADSFKQYPKYKMQNRAELFSVHQTAEIVKAYIDDFSAEIKRTRSQMPMYSWVIMAVLVVIFIAAGIFLWRPTSALCCATLGTMLIFGGMILLLLYKGSAPISSVYRKAPFYLGVFIVMAVFGTIEQLLLCKRPKGKPVTKKETKTNGDKQEPEERTPSWRTT